MIASFVRWSLTTTIALMAVTLPAIPAARAQATRPLTVEGQAVILAKSETPAAGASDADVTVVEFFDYNCPFCRAMHPRLIQLLREDPKVRVLYKEWPVFGKVSEYAARSAIAAKWQGKYLVAHDALITSRQDLDAPADIDATLKTAGIDLKKLDQDRKLHATEIDATLARAANEAQALGLRGTPGLIVGREFVPSSLTVDALKQLVGQARTLER